MKRKRLTPTEQARRCGENIRERRERWLQVYKYGCDDPGHPDGINLNLIRNHILHYRRICEEALDEPLYPPEYFMELPPEVENNYMARADIITEEATQSLDVLSNDPDYQYLQQHIGILGKRERSATNIEAVLGYVSNLRAAILNGDLVAMRRYRTVKGYIASFKNCRARVEAALKESSLQECQPGYQMTLFKQVDA